MTTSEWITVGAIIAGPILAVQAQKLIEHFRERKSLRLWVFKRLMATRGAVVSPAHVEALNMIELEFSRNNESDRNVRNCWREYLDQLGSLSQNPEQQQRQLESWTQRNGELLANLLVEMGRAVGYDFDRVQIRRGIYVPTGHANFEIETQAIRRGLIQVLLGQRSLPVATGPAVSPSAAQTDQTSEAPSPQPPAIEA